MAEKLNVRYASEIGKKGFAVSESKLTAELNGSLAGEVLRQAATNLRNRPKILGTISRFAQDWEKEVLATRGGATGRTWKPLAASTRGRPLVRTGVLKRMITDQPRVLKASVQVRAPDYARFLIGGRAAKNAKTATGQRKGAKGLGGDMPRRNPIPRPPRDRLAILTGDILAGVTPKE